MLHVAYFYKHFHNTSMIQEYCRLRVSPLLRIALPVSYVDEVLQLKPQDISPIPGVDPCLLGITNQRGSFLWVLLLEKFLGIKPTSLAKPIVSVSLRTQMPEVGMRRLACVVMAFEEIITLDSQKFVPVPDKLPPRAKALFSGVTKIENNTYGILNVNEMFRLLNPDVGGDEAIIAELADISTA